MGVMTVIKTLVVVAGVLVSSSVIAQQHRGHVQEKPMKLIGKKLLLRYQSGLQVVGHYSKSTEITWEALTGPAKGSKGTEAVNMAEVAPNTFFVSWVEKSGTTVSQVLDLERSLVTAFVTFDTPKGRQGLFDRGTLTEQQ